MQTIGAALLVLLLRTLMVRADDSLMRQMRTYQLERFVGGSCFAQLMGEGGGEYIKAEFYAWRRGGYGCCTRLIEKVTTLGDDAEVLRNRMRKDRGGGESHVLFATIRATAAEVDR